MRNATKGVLLMLGSDAAFCAMAVLIRCAAHIDSFTVALSRFVIGAALLGTAALFGKIRLSFVHGPLLFARGLAGGIAVFLFFLSISKLGIGKGTIISYSYPVFAALFGALLLKERVGPVKAVLVAAALAGICLMTGRGDGARAFSYSFGMFELLAVCGAVLSGIAVVAVKKLHDTDSTYAIFFAQCVIGIWLVILPANLSSAPLGFSGGVVLLGVGISAAVGQLLMTEGYRYVSVFVGSLMGMLVPILNFFAGILFFRETFSAAGVVGAFVVVLSCLLVIFTERRQDAVGRAAAARMPR